jgi:hypothetical protein
MSDATTDNGFLVDRRRALASIAAACVLHAAILVALALGVGIGAAATVTPPVTIDLLVSSDPGMDALAESATGGAGAAAGGGAESAGTAVAAPAAPASPLPSVPAVRSAVKGSDTSGFVIPTPRARPTDAAPASGGPAFRETGGRTGVVQGIPSVPSAVPAPAVAPVQQGSGAGSAASSGSGASSVQHSGTGVLVAGSSGSAPAGKLDLSPLDKSLAGAGSGKGAGRPASSGAGGTGAGTGGAGGGGSGTGASGGQPYSVSWEGADAGKERTLVPPVVLP